MCDTHMREEILNKSVWLRLRSLVRKREKGKKNFMNVWRVEIHLESLRVRVFRGMKCGQDFKENIFNEFYFFELFPLKISEKYNSIKISFNQSSLTNSALFYLIIHFLLTHLTPSLFSTSPSLTSLNFLINIKREKRNWHTL